MILVRWIVAAMTFLSGTVAAVRMDEMLRTLTR